ncbi:hypothetical protein RAAC3_TM7C00001G0181 [Candidatus Saccharibacteria bacterium RAAC3_TM7_1]|nr:hypothetical protein RAAC3_TM7C00001G0181 [Candidatus Saccharibacteria bacterium RAAC3_TM7_1]
MNKLKSALIIGAGVATVGVGGGSLAATSSAMSGSTSASTSVHASWKDEFDTKLASALAAKYDLNTDEVKGVIDEVRAQIIDEKHFATLQQALSDGKITQDQYDYVVAAVKEIDSLRDDYRQATTDQQRADIKAELKTKTTDLRTWLEEQDISMSLLGGYMMENYYYHGSANMEHHWGR